MHRKALFIVSAICDRRDARSCVSTVVGAFYGQEELDAVTKIEMLLDRDEFLVTYDPAKAEPKLLIATIRKSGYTVCVVSGKNKSSATMMAAMPRGFPLLDEA